MRQKTQSDFVKTALRVPPELHARLHEAAKGAGRTYNAEIITRLESSFATSTLSIIEQALQRVSTESLVDFDKAIRTTLEEAEEARGAVSSEISRRTGKDYKER